MTKPIRPIRIEGNVAYVPLTKGYEAIIDAADIPLVDGKNWFSHGRPHRLYAASKSWQDGKAVTVMMHRFIQIAGPEYHVDHIDGNGLNNRRANLRSATPAENQYNRKRNRNNQSGIKGVGWSKAAGKWQARISVNGQRRHLGVFVSKKDAAIAYAMAVAEGHGPFGRLE